MIQDFIKTLSISSANTDFMGRVYDTYNCPKYISVGLSDVAYVNDHIVPLIGDNDKLIHTCLSHNGADQNLGDIRLLGKSALTKITRLKGYLQKIEGLFTGLQNNL